jgi:hypothetical protein
MDDTREGSWRHYFVMCLCLAAKSSLVGVNADRLACPLHRPMACSHQMRGWDFMSGAALAHHSVEGVGVSPGEAKPSDWDICESFEHLGTHVIQYLHGSYCFYQCTFTLRWSSCVCVYP